MEKKTFEQKLKEDRFGPSELSVGNRKDSMSAKEISPEEIKRLIEKMKKKKSDKDEFGPAEMPVNVTGAS